MLEPFGCSDASWSLRLGNAEGKAAVDIVAETQITSANVGILSFGPGQENFP